MPDGLTPEQFFKSGGVQGKTHYNALKRLPNPTQIPNYFNEAAPPDLKKLAPNLNKLQRTSDAQYLRDARKQWFSNQVETAYYNNRGSVPLSFFLKQNEADLAFFLDPDFTPDVAEAMIDRGFAAYYARQRQAERDVQIDSSIDIEIERGRVAFDLFGNRQELTTGVESGPTVEEDLQEFIERGLKAPMEITQAAFSLIGGAITAGAGVVGWLLDPDMSAGGRGEAHLMQVFGRDGTQALFGDEFLESVTPAPTPELIQARDANEALMTGATDRSLERLFMGQLLPEMAWEQLNQERPDLVQEYVDMYGEEAYFGFALELQDTRDMPGIEEQMANWIEDVKKESQGNLDFLEETHFRSGADFLEVLDTMGEVSMGLGATVIAGIVDILDDEDGIIDELDSWEYWSNLGQAVDGGSFTPASAVGLEGTAVGFFLDVTVGSLFDPFSKTFLPRGRFGANPISTQTAIRATLDAPGVKGIIGEIPETMGSPSRNGMAKATYASAFAEVGLDGDLLHISGISDEFFPGRQYLQGPLGQVTDEVPLTTLRSVLDDVDTAALREIKPETIGNLERSLTNQGFKRPIQLAYDPNLKKVRLEDGAKRVAAIENMAGATRIPVTIRIESTPTVPARQLPEQVAAEVLAAPGEFVFHGTSMIPDKVLDDIQAGNDTFRGGGLTTTQRRAEAYAAEVTLHVPGQDGIIFQYDDLSPAQIRKMEGGTPIVDLLREVAESYASKNKIKGTITSNEGTVLVIRRSDLTPEQQATVAGGMDIEELSGSLPVAGVYQSGTDVAAVTGGRFLDELGAKEPITPVTRTIDGSEFMRPSQLFSQELMGRGANDAAILGLTEKGLAMGMHIPGLNQSWVATALGHTYRGLLESRLTPGRLEPYIATTYNQARVPISAVGGMKRFMDNIQFLGAGKPEFVDFWLQRTLENRRALAVTAQRIARENAQITELRLILNRLRGHAAGANGWKADVASGIFGPQFQAFNFKNIGDAQQAVLEAIDEATTAAADVAMKSTGAIPWQQFADEMLDDLNRKYIATNPEWAEFVGPDGLVDWDHIRRTTDLDALGIPRRGSVEQQQAALKLERQNSADAAVAKTHFTERISGESALAAMKAGRTADSVTLPATPLELSAAMTVGGARYTKAQHVMMVANLRHISRMATAVWKVNVLATPRTFGVMSIDEILSHSEELGMPWNITYMQLRSDYARARLTSFFTGRGFRVAPGTNPRLIGEKAMNRIRSLQDLPGEFSSYEQSLAEAVASQTTMMQPGDVGYTRAAQLYVQSEMQNPAWRAYLGGTDSFRAWFEDSAEGEQWRLNNQVRYQTEGPSGPQVHYRYIQDWQEAYQIADLNWKRMEAAAAARGAKPADIANLRQAWIDNAARLSNDPSGRIHSMPQWTYDYFGPLEGTRPVYPGPSLAWDASARFFEVGAANPAAFRQGLAAQVMRENEKTRLHSLFESQGRPVVSELELISHLQDRGLPASALDITNREWLDLELARSGIYTESYVARLAEQRSRDFVAENTYTFEQGSRAGVLAAQTVAPFGRAWGDMWARWSRSLFSRAQVRPWTNKVGWRQFNAGNIIQKIANYSPVNPRTLSKLSRVAALDFNITGGLYGEQETDLDFSPLIFLPNAESGSINTMIPGLGIIPIAMLDQAVELWGPDPVENPVEYQQMIDAISYLVPGMSIRGRNPLERAFGGGNTGLAINSLIDLQIGLFHNSSRDAGRFTGNLNLEVRRNRAVSAVWADPEFMNLVLEQDDPEAVQMLLLAAWRDANQETAKFNLRDNFFRWAVPVRGGLDPSLDELYEAWVGAARSFPDLLGGGRLGSYTNEQLQDNPDLLKSVGDDIRRQFYDTLAPWERELIIATNPSLAINMISTWEWAPDAPFDLPDRDGLYRIGVSTEDVNLEEALARHNIYVQRGWVVPGDSALRGHNILGRVLEARQNSARTLYESTAKEMNDILWEAVVSDESKGILEFALQDPVIQSIGITDARKLWEEWNTKRDVIIDAYMSEAGIEPGTEEEEELLAMLRDAFRVPEAEQAWSTEWRGDDTRLFSDRTLEAPVFFNEQSLAIADALQLDVEEGMTGQQFVDELIAYRSLSEGGVWNAVKYNYTGYQESRGRPYALAAQTLLDLTQNPGLDETWRNELSTFVEWADNMSDRSYNEGSLPRSVQDEAVDKFNRLATASRDAPVNWDVVWRDGFSSTFGPRNWQPPEPKLPWDEETGELGPDTWLPYIRDVVDGDTLVVSRNPGPPVVEGEFRGDFLDAQIPVHKVRLLGVMAADVGDNQRIHTKRLEDALAQALRDGESVYLVRDPDYAGSNVDPFGRELAWLWIGEEPYFFADELQRGQ